MGSPPRVRRLFLVTGENGLFSLFPELNVLSGCRLHDPNPRPA